MMNKFSIIIIAYNNPKEISATLESINKLDYPQDLFEAIIIDDGSKIKLENSINIKLTYIHKFHYIERTLNSSRSNARNEGALHAQHRWLIFIDGDQYLNSHLLNIYNDYINANNNKLVVLGSRIDLSDWQSKLLLKSADIQKTSKLIRNQKDNRLFIKQILKEKFVNAPGIWTLFWSHNFVIDKALFNQIGKFDTSFIHWGFEDVELGYRLTKAGYQYEIIENYVFHFYEENKMNVEKHYNWIKNLENFYKKHDDISIIYQWFFYESFSSSNPEKQEMYDMFIRFSSKINFLESMKNRDNNTEI